MNDNQLIDAYNKMIAHIHEDLGDASKTLARALDAAREQASEIGGLTQEEINKVADFVKRDIEEVAHSLTESDGESLTEWLKFDIDMIENFAFDAFMGVADKTRLELAKLEQLARINTTYQTDEIMAPGTLTCVQCGESINFTTTSVIPKCPKCGSLTFQRS